MQIRWTWCPLLVATITLAACSNTGGGGPGPNAPLAQSGNSPSHIFLEVGPQRKTCSAGAGRQECLQVRELRYADTGVKTYTGQWENFYSEIDGYKHEAGVTNILRINRYKRQNVPADASSYAYVLDMVVSSSIESKRK